MSRGISIPETRVLAIASHVSYGHVGNTMATFCMQTLGIDVTAINTVYFSNHTGYKHWKGRKVTAEEIAELYDGLKENRLNSFDMMLSGYIASSDAVTAVGKIARDIRLNSNMKPGSFFWVLDPVMGDQGQLYVSEDIVPVYRSLLSEADLIVPNCFEAELLSEVKITDKTSLVEAITKLHATHRTPHIIVTSVQFADRHNQRISRSKELMVVGSSCRSDLTPRIFSITVPAIPVFFSGTGDMFASLMVARLREAVQSSALSASSSTTTTATTGNQTDTAKRSWPTSDDVPASQLPLAAACAKVLRSMHAVLSRTATARDEELREEVVEGGGSAEDERVMHLRRTRASEVRVVQFAGLLRECDAVEGEAFMPVELRGEESER